MVTWYDKLTQAEKQIWKLIYYHPTYIVNRSGALNLLFCAYGTGLEWRGGEIIDTIPDNYLTAKSKDNPSFEKDLYERAHRNSMIKESMAGLLKYELEFLKEYNFFESCLSQYVRKNIEKMVTVSTPKKSFFPMCKYSNLMCAPENIKSDWLDLAIETCDLILLCDPNYVAPTGGHQNRANIKMAKEQREKLAKLRKDPVTHK